MITEEKMTRKTAPIFTYQCRPIHGVMAKLFNDNLNE